jgi:hypothetical protein
MGIEEEDVECIIDLCATKHDNDDLFVFIFDINDNVEYDLFKINSFLLCDDTDDMDDDCGNENDKCDIEAAVGSESDDVSDLNDVRFIYY